MTEKKGEIQDVIFHNSENGYSIIVVDAEDEEFTAVGYLPSCSRGRAYVFRGEFVNHPKYGEQFSFTESEELMPGTEEGMVGFLSSGILKGIGPKAAGAIVAKFGSDTFDVIENDPGRLTSVSGIGEKKAEAISEAFRQHREFARVTLEFQKYGINAAYALRLYKQYGAEAAAVVERDPYQLIGDISGIGFLKADAIAKKLGIAPDDDGRIKSGIKYLLWHMAGDGNTYSPESELLDKSAEMLGIARESIENMLVSMAFEGDIKIDMLDGQKVVYLFLYYEAEQRITSGMRRLNFFSPVQIDADLDSLISQTEAETGMKFSEEQKEAIKTSLGNSVSVITGGPGTGKTTIINAILRIFEHGEINTAVAAPTGRVAKRITETTGHPASTIHRLLEYYYSEGEGIMRFGKTAEDPLDYDAVIIDEASMIDLMLMDGLVSAISAGTRLILVGDADQLPSVGAGNVLRDIIDSEFIYSIRLREIFRQARESLIVVNAHRINAGEYPECNDKDKDFFMMRRSTVPEMADTIVDLCKRRLPDHYEQYDAVRDIQVLTPVRKGPLGCDSLNKRLQDVLNPPAEDVAEKTFGSRTYREGDKVMQIKNNYSLKWKKAGDFTEGEGIFNGDVGFIEKIDSEFNEMTVVFDENKYVKYDMTNLDELEMAYAITVHKSQGSEFPIMVMPVSWFPPVLATRNLLYTAVTRGKKIVVLVGSENSMHNMIDNNRIKERYSGLGIRLKALNESV